MVTDIPIILINYQQVSCLKMLVAQMKLYCPQNPIYIIDNASTYPDLINFYNYDNHYEKDSYEYFGGDGFEVYRFYENDFIKNVNYFIDRFVTNDHFVLSDSDILLHPTVPFNFLEIFKAIIDKGVHHVGFDLIYDDIPEWNPKAGWIQGDEKALHNKEFEFFYNEKLYYGWKAPIDTTFCLYKKSNSGWSAPMPPEQWDNSVRIFKAFHLPWYLDARYLNEEMKNYYATVKTRDNTKPSAGVSHFNPMTGIY